LNPGSALQGRSKDYIIIFLRKLLLNTIYKMHLNYARCDRQVGWSARLCAKHRKTAQNHSLRVLPFEFYPHTNICKTPLQQLDAFSSYRHVCFYFLIVSASREAGRSRPVGLEPLHKPKFDLPDKDILDPLGRFDSLVFLRF
jgi:hypothetical protein